MLKFKYYLNRRHLSKNDKKTYYLLKRKRKYLSEDTNLKEESIITESNSIRKWKRKKFRGKY